MAEPAVPLSRRRIELPLPEVRTRLTQIARLTRVTGQVTVITDRGQPVAAIVPLNAIPSDDTAPSAASHTAAAAAGWTRRIEQVREAVRRQHAARIAELEHALADAWTALDRLRPKGGDRIVDELRITHRDVLARPLPADDASLR